MISTNYIVKGVCELLADKVPGGYSLPLNGIEVPLYLNKDETTSYPEIRLSPFIEKDDALYQKYIEEKSRKYRYWEYGVFQVDIYAEKLSLAQNIYDVLTKKRLFDFFNLETVIFNWNNDFEQVGDSIYRNKSFAILDDGLFKDIYGIRIGQCIFKRVETQNDLVENLLFNQIITKR